MTHQDPHLTYLQAQVHTATPQKLRLMLIDGALRFAQQALEQWADPLPPAASHYMARCRLVVCELHGSIDVQQWEPAQTVADIYRFLYQQLCLAAWDEDRAKLDGVIDVLRSERETWHQLCEKMPDALHGHARRPAEILSTAVPPLATPAASRVQFEA